VRRASAIILFLAACSGALPALDNEPTGFRDLTWGTVVSDVDGMQVVKEKGPAQYWLRDEESPSVAGVDVEAVLYLTLEGRLEGVAAVADDGTLMRDSLAAVYGEPDEQEQSLSLWEGRNTVIILNEHDDNKAELVICTMKYYAQLAGGDG